MSYQAPYVGSAGLILPSYADILAYLVSNYQSIFGSDVYLGNDSQDYQWISVMALLASDTMKTLQLDYNNRSPLTAIQTALDSLMKINGISRKAASFSTCDVTINGYAGTIILNGVVGDSAGYKWNLPVSVTIPAQGAITVTATCQTIGAIAALPGTITSIVTPTYGWVSVTNVNAAILGQPAETDAQLRARQAISIALPSKTLLVGTMGAIASINGVTRYNIFENPTGSPDTYGTPAHSITCVVEGGAQSDIAYAIYNNSNYAYTNGTTEVDVTDPVYGFVTQIHFYRPTYKPIDVMMTIHLLPGGTSALLAQIKTAIVNYLNSLQIGELVTVLTGIVGATLSLMPDLTKPIFSIESVGACLHGGTPAQTDISINFNEVCQGIAANITVTSV
jgi:uncharacterized phage protein gp47/JayE